MGTFLNPGKEGFSEILNNTYVDKTGLIGIMNNTLKTTLKLTCVSRPRRFGKSYAAKMLCAYYDKSCDSHNLFQNLKISKADSYEEHLNKYDVIYIDMAYIKPYCNNFKDFFEFINESVIAELIKEYPGINDTKVLPDVMRQVAEITGNRFVVIIDEWDAPIREAPDISYKYLDFLRSLFKGGVITDRIIEAAYMTGILPIQKGGSQSALSDFHEYTMTSPGVFAEYVGFTEEEVRLLCLEHGISFDEMKLWYDGYRLKKAGEIYNPNSVMEAIREKSFGSYWVQSSVYDNLLHYINMDFDGLSKTIAELIGGSSVNVNVRRFNNDLITFSNKNSVLTLLIHLGYLGYDEERETAFIPNEEIRIEFADTIKEVNRDETIKRVAESNKLITDTVNMNEEEVAAQIEKIHEEEAAALFYNNEQALRGIIKLAYFAYRDYYMSFEELPAGAGFADIVYFPKKDTTLPALLIELKWNKSAEGAIDQIKKKNYPEAIKDYGGEVLLVGINYDKEASTGERKHSCVIEKMKA